MICIATIASTTGYTPTTEADAFRVGSEDERVTPGAMRVLKELADDEECDLVQEGRVVYCGNRQTTCHVVNELINLMAVSILYRDGFKTKFTNYGINDTGRALVRRPELEAELYKAIHSTPRKPFQVLNDRISFLDR